MGLDFFEVDQALEMLRVAHSHDIGARNAIKNSEVDKTLEMLRVPLVLLVTALARDMRLIVFSTINVANNVTSRARKISPRFVERNVNF